MGIDCDGPNILISRSTWVRRNDSVKFKSKQIVDVENQLFNGTSRSTQSIYFDVEKNCQQYENLPVFNEYLAIAQ